jgi:hypothetical protein
LKKYQNDIEEANKKIAILEKNNEDIKKRV